MKTVAAVLISMMFVTPVSAQSTQATEISTKQQIDAEVLRLRELRRQAYANAKCSDENLAYDQAAYCFNLLTHGDPAGPIGTSHGE